MPLVYQEEFRVLQFECDPWDRMTPGAVLRRVQEIGTLQCELLGLTEEHYRATKTLFLLSRISLEMYAAPTIGQQVRIETRAYGMHRAVYQRVTTMYDAFTGEKLCEADSRWVLVNTETRRILRKEPEGFNSPFVEPPGAEGHSMDMLPHSSAESCGSFVAGYTLCDRNGHLNNTRYADLVCDCLPLEQLRQPVQKMLLFYRVEIPLGGEFELICAPVEAEESSFYVAAQDGRRTNFEAIVTF